MCNGNATPTEFCGKCSMKNIDWLENIDKYICDDYEIPDPPLYICCQGEDNWYVGFCGILCMECETVCCPIHNCITSPYEKIIEYRRSNHPYIRGISLLFLCDKCFDEGDLIEIGKKHIKLLTSSYYKINEKYKKLFKGLPP